MHINDIKWENDVIQDGLFCSTGNSMSATFFLSLFEPQIKKTFKGTPQSRLMTNKYNRKGQSKVYITEVKKCTIVYEDLLNIGIKSMSFSWKADKCSRLCKNSSFGTFSFKSLLGFMRMAVKPQILLAVKSIPSESVSGFRLL